MLNKSLNGLRTKRGKETKITPLIFCTYILWICFHVVTSVLLDLGQFLLMSHLFRIHLYEYNASSQTPDRPFRKWVKYADVCNLCDGVSSKQNNYVNLYVMGGGKAGQHQQK